MPYAFRSEDVDVAAAVFFNKRYIPEPNSGCWLWLGCLHNEGYALTMVARRRVRASRLSVVLSGRHLEPTDCVLHRCDNPPCVNPDHLYIGTRKDNAMDMARKGRNFVAPSRGLLKLTVEAVKDIRAQVSRGIPQNRVARAHGVSTSTIHYHVRVSRV